MSDERQHEFTNRLAKEQSPYLLQHAHNPVDWYPWGEEAFQKAKEENKPIFLSIGYSTCHWCHVMEHESFENQAVANIMNRDFVCIKVDREERPDVDKIYMTFVQATVGGGGWPLSVFLSPDLKPFVGGTYFPPHNKMGKPGLPTVLGRVKKIWDEDQAGFTNHGESVIQALSKATTSKAEGDHISASFAEDVLRNCYKSMAARFDSKLGGFGAPPKFPRPCELNFLLQIYAKHREKSPGPEALEMCTYTLQKMARGGMYDHVGGGFHRYSVDEYFHVPHFEKMLYDNAQLAVAYLTTFQITHDIFYKEVAESILHYIKRDMTHPEGGIFSAEDADSLSSHEAKKKEEGAFYVWTLSEITEVLGEEDAVVFADHFYVKEKGNCDLSHMSDPISEFVNQNVLIQLKDFDETAKKHNLTSQELKARIQIWKQKLFDARTKRPRPGLDDKIITAWNGQMISAFAKAHQILHLGCVGDIEEKTEEQPNQSEYLQSAIKAANFIKMKLVDEDGYLIRNYRLTASTTKGFLDDYTYLICGLLDLYEASFDVCWLKWAMDLQEKQDSLFMDSEGGGYFSTTTSDSSILLRMKEDHDGAEPSPNSIAVSNLLRLSKLFANEKMRSDAQSTINSIKERLEKAPIATPQMCASLAAFYATPRQIVLSGSLDPPSKNMMSFLKLIFSQYSPNTILALTDGGENQKYLSEMYDFYCELKPNEHGLTTAYLCEDFVCQMPTTNTEVLQNSMKNTNKL